MLCSTSFRVPAPPKKGVCFIETVICVHCYKQMVMGGLGALWGRTWTLLDLGRTWGFVVGTWNHWAALAEVLARSRSWGGLGSSRGDLGPVLGSPGGILGGHRAVRGRLGAISISI